MTAANDEPQERELGFYWIRVGRNAPEIAAFSERGWLTCGQSIPWPEAAVTVLSPRLVMRPELRVV